MPCNYCSISWIFGSADRRLSPPGSAADFMEGSTHAGMLHSAEWLLHHKTKTLVDLLERNPGFALHFIGHSLGAGGKP